MSEKRSGNGNGKKYSTVLEFGIGKASQKSKKRRRVSRDKWRPGEYGQVDEQQKPIYFCICPLCGTHRVIHKTGRSFLRKAKKEFLKRAKKKKVRISDIEMADMMHEVELGLRSGRLIKSERGKDLAKRTVDELVEEGMSFDEAAKLIKQSTYEIFYEESGFPLISVRSPGKGMIKEDGKQSGRLEEIQSFSLLNLNERIDEIEDDAVREIAQDYIFQINNVCKKLVGITDELLEKEEAV